MPDRSRIPKDIYPFVVYMQSTDNHQKAIDSRTGNPRYLNWKWTPADSAKWSAFRSKVDIVYKTYRHVTERNTNARTQLIDLRRRVMKYDKDKRLLAKIGITTIPVATLRDYTIFRIKRGTPLEKAPSKAEADLQQPLLSIKSVKHFEHFLRVRNPGHKGWGTGDKIACIEIWRAIVPAGAPAPSADAYQYAGDARYGIFKSLFQQKDFRKDAYYKARMKSSRGSYSSFCRPVFIPVI
jgi:hypothetical protein